LAFEDSPVWKEVTLSVPAISSASLLDSSLASTLTAAATQTTTTHTSSASSSDGSNSLDALTQDIVKLLKDLAAGDVPGAKTDLAKFKADLKAQDASTASSNLGKDLTSLLKDLASGNTSGAKTDVSRVQVDLQAQGASGSNGAQTVSPLNSLVAKISDALSSGSVQGAIKDLSSYLVQQGAGTGGLINTLA
jgi:hypothetical protein